MRAAKTHIILFIKVFLNMELKQKLCHYGLQE
jgi:hypothetical protein